MYRSLQIVFDQCSCFVQLVPPLDFPNGLHGAICPNDTFPSFQFSFCLMFVLLWYLLCRVFQYWSQLLSVFTLTMSNHPKSHCTIHDLKRFRSLFIERCFCYRKHITAPGHSFLFSVRPYFLFDSAFHSLLYSVFDLLFTHCHLA